MQSQSINYQLNTTMNEELHELGFHTAPYDLVFKTEPDYSNLDCQVNLFNSISQMNNINICVLDFYKHGYFYISQNHLFLCGYTINETKTMGEKMAAEIIFEEDKQNQLEMKNAACLFFAQHDLETLKKLSLYTSHRLKHKNGNVFMVTNQYKPFLYDDEGKMWMALCITNFATKNLRIETYIELTDRDERYIYSPKRKDFQKTQNICLSKKERDVLALASQGFTSKDIGDKLFISLSTVKFHKQNILIKFNVQNIAEAILYAYSHNLF